MNLEKVKYHSRNIFDLTNQEIIRLVDFFINQSNLDRIAHSLYSVRKSLSRDIIYRKIEVKHAFYDWAYAVVVTLKFSDLNKEVKTGFILANNGGGIRENELYELDFQISSIKGFFEPFQDVVLGMVYNQYEIDFDYSHLLIPIKELYEFLDTDLRMWSAYLTVDKYANNPQLVSLYQKDKPDNYVLQELHETHDEDRLAELSK